MPLDLVSHLTRQIAFSRATFGPGARTDGVVDHIRKELREVLSAPSEEQRIDEWVDVVILALDGLTRSIAAFRSTLNADDVAEHAVAKINFKQGKNEKRDWPDWRTAQPGKAIEHVKGTHD